MIDFHRFLKNPFDDSDISLDELMSFSTDHLQRLVANNPGGIWAARIAATSAAIEGVDISHTSDLTKLGLRKAKKQVKDAFRAALPESVAKIHAVIVAKYGSAAPEVNECFPVGRKVFGTCTDDAVENHLNTLKTGLVAHQADLGAQVVTDATALITNWATIYGASESSTGAKSTTQADKKLARENLQLELFKNLLTIGLQFPRQPEQLDLYMQQSLLEDQPTEEEEPPTPPGG